MGCKQSKASNALVLNNNGAPPTAAANKQTTIDKVESSTRSATSKDGDEDSLKQQQQQRQRQGSRRLRLSGKHKKDNHATAATATPTENIRSNKKKPDTVYNELAKACSKEDQQKGSSSIANSRSSSIGSTPSALLSRTQETAETAGSANSGSLLFTPPRSSPKQPTASSSSTAAQMQKLIAAVTPDSAAYSKDGATTPLHMAVQLLNLSGAASDSLLQLLSELLRAHPQAVRALDAAGHLPLHYAVAPNYPNNSNAATNTTTTTTTAAQWKFRTTVVRLLVAADSTSCSRNYLARHDVPFGGESDNSADADGDVLKCSPLYRALQCLPDDPTPQRAPTLEFVQLLLSATPPRVCALGNAGDGDKPLALLYRRFTRQFDLAEKFFAGDNSRPSVVRHRHRYKTAAGNTWKLIELLLMSQQQPNHNSSNNNANTNNNKTTTTTSYRTVHRAVQGETPPDLLRYIVETNAHDLTVQDEAGNLPLHYAAQSKPPPPTTTAVVASSGGKSKNGKSNVSDEDKRQHFPAFYSKYVLDELLYKFPEAAAVGDARGRFPLTLAVEAGKQWIGGGIKSLYDAYPEALQQIDLQQHPVLQRALSLMDDNDNDDDDNDDDDEGEATTPTAAIRDTVTSDEPHDAIMLVQQPDVDVSEVVTSMWAHEEDAGVQMLGCVALSRLLRSSSKENGSGDNNSNDNSNTLRIALTAVPAVVNAMKAHPNEVVVQEKACAALEQMACADGRREISFVASGACAAVVGAMQAHVSDPGVQLQACRALQGILRVGGADRATVVASVSGLTALVNALAAHPTVEDVQVEACQALYTLTSFAADAATADHSNSSNGYDESGNSNDRANLPDLPRQQTEPLLEAAKRRFPQQCGAVVDALLERMEAQA